MNRKNAPIPGIFIACLFVLLQHNVEDAKNFAQTRIFARDARDRGPFDGINVRHNLMTCFRTVTGFSHARNIRKVLGRLHRSRT
jgi:deferrochelatase/peroxidase EfeB